MASDTRSDDESGAGSKTRSRAPGDGPGDSREHESGSLDPAGLAQDLVFKTLTAGLAGLFSTQEALRKAVGDAMPAEWVEYASEQGDRAREELFDRVSDQITALIDSIDIGDLLLKMMQDNVVEVNASFRVRPASSTDDDDPSYEFSVKPSWGRRDAK